MHNFCESVLKQSVRNPPTPFTTFENESRTSQEYSGNVFSKGDFLKTESPIVRGSYSWVGRNVLQKSNDKRSNYLFVPSMNDWHANSNHWYRKHTKKNKFSSTVFNRMWFHKRILRTFYDKLNERKVIEKITVSWSWTERNTAYSKMIRLVGHRYVRAKHLQKTFHPDCIKDL